MSDSNTFIVDYGGKSQLFDLVFLNNDFFILKKHGDQLRRGRDMYYVYGNERSVGRLDWRNAMEELYNIYRKNSKFTIYIVLFIVIVGGVLFFTFA